jgi:hypothetical protein
MDWACGTYGGEERCVQDFSRETLGKVTTWKTQAKMELYIKTNLQKIRWSGLLDKIGLVQDRYKWQAFVSKEMKFGVP